MRGIYAFFVLFSAISEAKSQGIVFESMSNFSEIINRAKNENKLVLVDCFATWCQPCKYMDTNVYSKSDVGDFVNDKFISVKMQIDSVGINTDSAKELYKDVIEVVKKYHVTAFPTYLFFSKSGDLVHRGLGMMDSQSFIEMAKDALTPNKQFYTLIKNHQQGNKDYTIVPSLIQKARDFNELQLAGEMVSDYINSYLLNLSEDKLYSKEIIRFIGSNLSSKDRKAFNIFYQNATKVDSVMNAPGYAVYVISKMISAEDIYPYIIKNSNFNEPIVVNPKWNEIQSRIVNKYGEMYANRNILVAKINWYKEHHEFNKLIAADMECFQKYVSYPTDNSFINNRIWEDIFMNSSSKKILKKAIKIMEKVLSLDTTTVIYLDTYANLLYKVGRKEEAILLQEKAFSKKPSSNNIKRNLECMKLGLPTWKVNIEQ